MSSTGIRRPRRHHCWLNVPPSRISPQAHFTANHGHPHPNLASQTACCRRHTGIAERPTRPVRMPHCCHATTSTPRTRPPLPVSSTPALQRPAPGAHGQPSHTGASPAGRLLIQACRAGAHRHRAASRTAKPPPLSAPSHRLHTQPPLTARLRWSTPPLRRRVGAATTHPSPGVDPASCCRSRAWEQPPLADPAAGHRIHTHRRRIRRSSPVLPRAVPLRRPKQLRPPNAKGNRVPRRRRPCGPHGLSAARRREARRDGVAAAAGRLPVLFMRE
jgi:hypothetical protein